MPKASIYLDLDGMAVFLYKKLLGIHNELYSTDATVDNAWEKLAPAGSPREGSPIAEALDHLLERDRIFHDLEAMPGFTDEVVRELQDMGDLSIASAASRNPDSASDKIRWVLERYPSIHRKKIILIKEKWRLRAWKDEPVVWLEDWHTNIREIRETNPTAYMAAIAYPYNEAVDDLLDLRAESFRDSAKAWGQIIPNVRRFISTGKRIPQ